MSRRILIVAGEASGDAQAAELAAAMLAADPGLDIFGVGGPRMREAGVRVAIDCAELSVMGFAELGGRLARIWAAYRELADAIRHHPPDLVVLVDYPDFNLRLARVARRAGVPVFYYVSPQVWAWRRGRIRKIARLVDRMVVLFPFEVDLYRAHGVDVHFVGHPLAERVSATRSAESTRARYGLALDRPAVALLPGSRRREVDALLPVMLQAAERLLGKVSFAVSCAPGLEKAVVARHVERARVPVALVEGDTYNLLAACDVAAVASGTATVECALLGVPMVVVYRMSALSYAIARALVRVPYVAMPNLLLGEAVVPELIQRRASAEGLATALRRYLDDPRLREQVSARLADVRSALVRPGAAGRAARLALELAR